MDTVGYQCAAAMLRDRVEWTLSVLGARVATARSKGWIEGEPMMALHDPESLCRAIALRLGATVADQETAPMAWMAEQLALASEEMDALWLLSCIELDHGVARLVQVFGSPDCPDMSLQLWRALVELPMQRVESLANLGLIEISTDPRLPHHRRPVRASDRLVEIATGELRLDGEIRDLARISRCDTTSAKAQPLADAVRASRCPPALLAHGPDGSGRATLLREVAAALDSRLLEVETSRLSRDGHVLDRQLRSIVREARLFDAIPFFVRLDDDASHPVVNAIGPALKPYEGTIFYSAREPFRSVRPAVVHEMKVPTVAERIEVWTTALTGAPSQLLEDLGDRYRLRPGSIVASARNALARCPDVSVLDAAMVHRGIRAELGERMGTIATRIETRQRWDDLVIPVDQFDQILELVARVRQRRRVLDDWGFGDKIGKGHGIASLFSGPPGTGKTMAAGLIARELGLDLYQVDLSQVVNKYIGETEKQLATLFDAAETGQAIILFDEADSLFAKRSEVRSSNDRYANLEVNFLLQRMEAFTGIAILTTNHERSIDDAFRRRLAIQVRFPLPDEAHREELWRAMIPAKASVQPDIDFACLAKEYAMSGGYVKNAVLRAAYLAAEQSTEIAMSHLWQAARTEYEAMGMIVRS